MIRIMNIARPLLILSILISGTGFRYKTSRIGCLTCFSQGFLTKDYLLQKQSPLVRGVAF